MTTILGISALYHDSAAALIDEDRIIAAAQEERFTRIKHDAAFPKQAVAYCLAEAGRTIDAVDHVVFYEKPLLKFDRLLETWIEFAPRGIGSFMRALPLWLRKKLHQPREFDAALGGRPGRAYLFTEHHEAHAASAFFPSPFDEAAILTVDGVGEWATTTLGVGRGNRIELLKELRFPHSLGLLYSAFTYFCGFRVNSGEYKLMGLAPFGRPTYRDLILENLIDLKADGSLRLDMRWFTFGHRQVMVGKRFARLFGGPPRRPESPITQREMDLAASIQAVTEEAVLRMARHAHELTGQKHLVMAGGVALNCVANGRVLREGPFEDLWVQPAAGDAGGALGAALFVRHQLLEIPRDPRGRDLQQASLLGPAFTDEQARVQLASVGADYEPFDDDAALAERVAALIADGAVVGVCRGRMEYGPRALGNRSILGDPRDPTMQSRMNLKVKFRESFRPFAPCVTRERAAQWFEAPPGRDSPYMLFTAAVRPEQRINGVSPLSGDDLLARLAQVRSRIPAVTHVDHSARVQTVDAQRNPWLHQLLMAFEARTGCPVLINTSFNVRGEPIVCTPCDAYRCFMATDIDALVLGRCLLTKRRQPRAAAPARRPEPAFALD
jgi:carbamoyltransferase